MPWPSSWPEAGAPVRYPAGRRCPRCGAFLATDNEGPRCSPCEHTVITREIVRAIAAAEARPPAPATYPPTDVQADTMLRALRSGPKSRRDLEAALHLAGHRATVWKQLLRYAAELERRGHRITVTRGGTHELVTTAPTSPEARS